MRYNAFMFFIFSNHFTAQIYHLGNGVHKSRINPPERFVLYITKKKDKNRTEHAKMMRRTDYCQHAKCEI